MTRHIKRALVVLAVFVSVVLLSILAWGIYNSVTDTEPPVVFTVTNDTDKTVEIINCLTDDIRLEPGQDGTVEKYSRFPRGASCYIVDENSGEYKGCLFAPNPLVERVTVPVSYMYADVPTWECGIPRGP